jgi:acyl phosphate:glycerol-3-phosphate acyltransferase
MIPTPWRDAAKRNFKMSTILIVVALSYLLGSIPFGFLLVRLFRGEDVRHSGSSNIGATNVSRKSPTLGALTLLLDALKGSAAVVIAIALSPPVFRNTHLTHVPGRQILTFSLVAVWAAVAALCAIIGHMFPAWLNFRGGKGVATGLGSFAVIAPKAVLIAAGIFLIVVLALRYISLGSIMAVAAFPVAVHFTHEYARSWPALALMWVASLLIVAKHHENIRRLLAGTENRFGAARA